MLSHLDYTPFPSCGVNPLSLIKVFFLQQHLIRMENVQQFGAKAKPHDATLEKSSKARSGSFAVTNAISRPLKSDKVQLPVYFSMMLRISLLSLRYCFNFIQEIYNLNSTSYLIKMQAF